MTWAAVAIGGATLIGGGITAAGQASQASSANKAAKQAGIEENDHLWYGMMMQKKAELGGGEKLARWIAANVPQDSKDRIFGTADFQQEVTKSATPAVHGRGIMGIADQQAAQTAEKQYKTVKGVKPQIKLEDFLKEDEPGYLTKMEGLKDQYGQLGIQNLNDSRAIEAQARSFGLGERATINRNAERAVKEGDRSGTAQLAAAGLGGTSLGASMASGNRANVYRAKQDALGSLDDRTNAFLTSLRQGTLGVKMGMQDRNLNLAQNPINQQIQLSSSNAFNPWVNKDTTQYNLGMSPGGSAASAFGNTLTAAGGLYGGYLSQQNNPAGTSSYGGMFNNKTPADINRIKGYP